MIFFMSAELQICSLEEAQMELGPIRSKNYVGPEKTKLAGSLR